MRKNLISESRLCELHAIRACRQREAEEQRALSRGNTHLQAMLAEGRMLDKALEPLKLDHAQKMEYVAKNTLTIKSEDGHEAIQIIWANAQAICVHRLLSKEFRSEFQAFWLGVWAEGLSGTSKKKLVSSMKQKLKFRAQQRQEFGNNAELAFAAYSPSMVETKYEF